MKPALSKANKNYKATPVDSFRIFFPLQVLCRVVVFFHTKEVLKMATAIKRTISLPRELAEEAEEIAKEEKKTLSGVIQDALRYFRKARLKNEFLRNQDYWSRLAKEKGILTEADLKRYLEK